MKVINCQRFLGHNFRSSSLCTLSRATFGAAVPLRRTCLVFLSFSLLSRSGSNSVSFFHHKLVKRVTPLLIGYVPSDLHRNWRTEQRGLLSLSSPSLSLTYSLSLSLSWLCSRVGWFGMTISQGRNADNRSELPGVAASQLTRNKAVQTEVRKQEEIEALT